MVPRRFAIKGANRSQQPLDRVAADYYYIVAQYRNNIPMEASMTPKNNKLIYELHAQVCSVLSNAKRLEIIDLLRSGEKTAGDLTREMEIPKPNVSQQLTILREKGVLLSRREGQHIYYRLSIPKMLKAYDLLRQVLMEHLREQGNVAARIGGKPHA